MQIINQLKLPESIKELNEQQTKQLSNDLKKIMLDLSKNKSIHFSSNLGVIELTIALLKIFDPLKDSIIFDVGHQAYIYKILTDRKDRIYSIRDYLGLSGFQDPYESKYDKWSAGHAGTALSGAIGIKQTTNNNVVCVIGDGALSNGLTLEALDANAILKQKLIIIVNDNDMSIAPDFGGIHDALVNARNNIHPNFFENLGYKYIGVVNGHDINDLTKALKDAKDYVNNPKNDMSIVVHIKTKKGSDLVNDVDGSYHSYQQNKNSVSKIQNSNGAYLANHLIQNIQQYKNIKVVSPSMTFSTGFYMFKEQYPEYFLDLGIQEENAATICAGIALSKKDIPILVTYATFIQRSYDELLHDVSRMHLPTILLLDRADLATGDGSSHMGIYDVGMLKSIPNTIITSGMTKEQNAKLLDYAIKNNKKNIFAIRYAASAFLNNEELSNEINQYEITNKNWQILKHNQNNKICFVSYGTYYFKLFSELKEIKNVSFVNALFINQNLNENMQWLIKQNFKEIIIYERINNANTLADEIKKYCFDNNINIKVSSFAYSGFIEQGSLDQLDKNFNMSIKQIKEILIK